MALVLTRKKDEAFLTNGPARIRVVRVERSRVVLSIEADKMTTILREEVYLKQKKQKGGK